MTFGVGNPIALPLDEPKLTSFSHSRRKDLKTCARLYFYKHVLKLYPVAIKSQGRRMGDAFAHSLEFEDPAKVWEKYESWIKEGKADLDELRIEGTIAEVLAEGYLRMYDGKDSGYTEVIKEREFDHPIGNTGYTNRGKLDALKYDAALDQYVIEEDKLLNPRFWFNSNELALKLDEQVTGYFWAADKSGKPAHKCEYRVTLKPNQTMEGW